MPRKPKQPPEGIKYPGVRERGGVFRFRYDIINPETGKRKQKESDPFPTALEAFTAGIKIKEELNNNTYVEKNQFHLMIAAKISLSITVREIKKALR